MFWDLRFPDRNEEERFASLLVSRRVEARWWDVMRTLIAICALFKHISEVMRGTGPVAIAAIYCFTVPVNLFESVTAQKEIGSWRFRAVLGVFTTIMNTIVTSFLYSTVFPPRTLEGWQAFGPSMAGSFWVFYHMNRYSPIIPFYFQYVFFGCIAFIHLAGLPRVCRTDRNLQWLASKFFGGLLSLCSLFEYSRRVWKPRLVHFLEGPPWQCTLFQGFTLIVFGFLLVSHMTFVWELRLRKRYAVDRLSRRTAKRLLEDSPSSVDHFMYFGIPGVCIVVLFALKLGIFDRLV